MRMAARSARRLAWIFYQLEVQLALAEIVLVGADPDGVPRCADEVERSSP